MNENQFNKYGKYYVATVFSYLATILSLINNYIVNNNSSRWIMWMFIGSASLWRGIKKKREEN